MTKALQIGQVAILAGVRVDTVRYYERRGVLPVVPRRASGYREFTMATVERIRLARELQGLGFTLKEISELLRAVDAGNADCASETPRFRDVLQRVDDRLRALHAVRKQLAATLDRCAGGSCQILEKAGRTRKTSEARR